MSRIHEPNNSRTTSWGKIFSDELAECEDEDLLEQLQLENNNILIAKRILRGSATDRKPTSLIRIKSDTPQIPPRVFCFLESFKFELYIPSPKKCANCKRFGHSASAGPCRSQWTCNMCAKNHERDQACETNILTCIYCGPGHGSNDPNCPRYLEEKEIVELSYQHNVSYPQARIQLESGIRSYAATLRGNRPPTQPNNTPSIPSTESHQTTRIIAVETSTVGTDFLPIENEVSLKIWKQK